MRARSVPNARIARGLRALALATAGLAAALPAPASADPDLNDLALLWSRGRFGAPLLCRIGDAPQRGVRWVTIAPGPRTFDLPVNRITFHDLAADGAQRCFTATGSPQVNVVGNLLVSLPRRGRPDTARHDFESLLRHDGGVEFQIRSGKLALADPAAGGSSRDVDFEGGTARLAPVQPGTDAAKLLSEFPKQRKLSLRIESKDGEALDFHLVQQQPEAR